ncbi:DUF481 domain-containing protein [Aestuariibacter salexigens]|uniref:DUF481 domain-containing protein n=1 Tax=Aestuariibacter salexigens TaxID=226010 RepID=UPI00042066A7|nr:DUF481 domain-containing protein [Aestuariibacter salexigens]
MKHYLVPAMLAMSATAIAQEETKPFTMDGELGIIFTTGNSETTSVKARVTAAQELNQWSNDYLIEGTYKKDTTEVDMIEQSRTTAQRFFASAQGNYKLENPDHRLFGFASYEDNRFSNFKYQATLAAGWSQRLWKDDVSSFEYSVGPGYAFSKTQDDESRNGAIVRGSLGYKWNISETSKFTQVLSTEIGSDNTKSRSESALTANINGSLAMKLSVTLDHNTDVAPGVDKLDTETSVTLVYSFF